MNIVYLHGLESNPNCDKVEWLRSQGHKVHSPRVDYSKENEYNRIHKLCRGNCYDLIIGSSMGGWFGWNLGKMLKVPVLLFNPAMLAPTLSGVELMNSKVFLGLGKNDDIINPELTIKLLTMIDKRDFNPVNICMGDHGHQTPIEFLKSTFYQFEEDINYANKLYREIKLNE